MLGWRTFSGVSPLRDLESVWRADKALHCHTLSTPQDAPFIYQNTSSSSELILDHDIPASVYSWSLTNALTFVFQTLNHQTLLWPSGINTLWPLGRRNSHIIIYPTSSLKSFLLPSVELFSQCTDCPVTSHIQEATERYRKISLTA